LLSNGGTVSHEAADELVESQLKKLVLDTFTSLVLDGR
jgi:hypothetical protein